MPVEELVVDSATDTSNGSTRMAQVEKKFVRLRDEWKAQRGHEPSTMKAVLLPVMKKYVLNDKMRRRVKDILGEA